VSKGLKYVIPFDKGWSDEEAAAERDAAKNAEIRGLIEERRQLSNALEDAESRLGAETNRADALLTLARQYASECGECLGIGRTTNPEDGQGEVECPQCQDIRDAIAAAHSSNWLPG
jgi:hypothetical protein